MGQGRYFSIAYGATLNDASEQGRRDLTALRLASFGPYSEPSGKWGCD